MTLKRYKVKLDFVIYVDENITYDVGTDIINNVTKGGMKVAISAKPNRKESDVEQKWQMLTKGRFRR